MKKTTILFVLLISTVAVQAQENIVKLGVGSLLNRTINLEYERVLTDKTSVLAEIGIGLPNNLNDGVVDATGANESNASIVVTDAGYNNFYFVGEYRYYTKGEGAKGFYIGPYLKLSNYSLNIDGTYTNTSTGATDIPSEFDLNMFVAAVGGTMGYQWIIKEKVTINWNILGVGGSLNRISGEFTSADEDVFEEWRQDVRDFLDEIPGGSGIDTEADNSTQTINASGGFGFVNLRLGVSVGYMF